MSEQTETTRRPLRVTTCFDPTSKTVSCYGLVEDTDDARREHRLWHKHEEAVKEGMRKAIRERDEEIGRLSREVGDAQRDVKGIVIPEPVLGIEISRSGWADDEDDSSPAYVDDDLAFPPARTVEDDPFDDDEFDEPARVTP